ncbi:unnamed protein product [Spirodela intermedia]|uniref:BRX domain-containing protein n=1 Tax=Spirodela intermedia TaxID=51605 RepID=A0A7I8JHB6_SPIIN|nr:unnamed protein product [Spirodela intermedia]CAA6669528.1 unnamed protein product [Spirodela intermedia]
MLTCLACSKQLGDAAEPARGNPSTKEAVKSLTSQFYGHHARVGLRRGQLGLGGRPLRRRGEVVAPRIGFQGGEPLSREGASYDVLLEDDDGEPKEWMALVEPGVLITFISLPGGGNDLKRIRFSREMFNKWQAQRWWGDNYDRIMELYNVQRFSRQGLPTPPRSEDERDSSHHSRPVPRGRARGSAITVQARAGEERRSQGAHRRGRRPRRRVRRRSRSRDGPHGRLLQRAASSPVEASRTTTSSRDEDTTEWVEQDDPGVYVTVRQLADGARELRRVKFRLATHWQPQHFSEVRAKQWWEENWERIQAQYL